MHRIPLDPAFIDARGQIFDLVQDQIDCVTLITFVTGAIRGNHVHHETTQWTLVTKGKLEVSTLILGNVRTDLFVEGDFFVSKPGEPHAMKALNPCEILVFTQGPRSGKDYQSDTFRVEII